MNADGSVSRRDNLIELFGVVLFAAAALVVAVGVVAMCFKPALSF